MCHAEAGYTKESNDRTAVVTARVRFDDHSKYTGLSRRWFNVFVYLCTMTTILKELVALLKNDMFTLYLEVVRALENDTRIK